jgi:hypothetical protein
MEILTQIISIPAYLYGAMFFIVAGTLVWGITLSPTIVFLIFLIANIKKRKLTLGNFVLVFTLSGIFQTLILLLKSVFFPPGATFGN